MRSIGYEAARGVLEIEFQSGAVYEYLDVPESVYSAFQQAESKGQYFNREIRDEYQHICKGEVRRAGEG